MIDNDIIKALEDIIKHLDFTQIKSGENVLANALDLINRQKAEIKQLNREIENLESIQEISPEAKHFVDTKADKVISLLNEVIKSQEQIKAEAITEFEQRLNDTKFKQGNDYVIYADNVSTIAKEMKEGVNNA